MRAALRNPDALVVLAIAGAAFGLFCRLYGFTWPAQFTFDEFHFVENARNYLAGKADWNDHPPLGKLFIAALIRALGDSALAWRLTSFVVGLATCGVGALAAKRLFASTNAALIALFLLATDGFLIAYSRTALLDGWLAFSVTLALLLATFDWSWKLALAFGALLGFATSIKFSGVCVGAVMGVSLLLSPRAWSTKLAWLVAACLVGFLLYVRLYALGLSIAGQDASLDFVLSETKRLYVHHAGLTEMKHPLTSSWFTWFLPARPITLINTNEGGVVRVLTMHSNPLVWWAASLAFFGCVVSVGFWGVRSVLTEQRDDFLHTHGRAVVLTMSVALGFIAPWILSRRDSYVYHYLPPYTALLLLLAGVASWFYTRDRQKTLLALSVALVTSAVLMPVWSTWPLASTSWYARTLNAMWR